MRSRHVRLTALLGVAVVAATVVPLAGLRAQEATRYYFHSASGLGNADTFVGAATFDKNPPTLESAASYYDVPILINGTATDAAFRGTIDSAFSALTVDFWQNSPVGSALGSIDYDVRLTVGTTAYQFPTIQKEIPPTLTNVPIRVTHTFTTVLGPDGPDAGRDPDEIPLSINPVGSPVTMFIRGHFADSQAVAEIVYDSTDFPSGFSVAASSDPDPTPTPTPTATPTPSPTPTQSPGGGTAVRGTYPTTPSDPYFGVNPTGPTDFRPTQWAPRKIQAPQAWQESSATGFGIKVAVLDSGVDLQHEDLQCPGKLAVESGSDVVANDSDPDDENGHGTHVAGIIGACTNNGKGVAGVAPDATIVPIRVLNAAGSGTDAQLIAGLDRATQAGVHVINMSLGYPPGKNVINNVAAINAAIRRAQEAGIVLVAAAGNDSFPLCEYPALAEDIICVGATDPRDLKSWYSAFPNKTDGQETIGPGLVAPGGTEPIFCDLHAESVLSLYPVEKDRCDEDLVGYRDLNGTSMATPHVAGVAALVYDRLGGVRNIDNSRAVIDAIIDSADDLGTPGYDPVFGFGRLNALKAVRAVTPAAEAVATSVAFTDASADSGQYSDDAHIEARLVDAGGAPLAGRILAFKLIGKSGTVNWSSSTNGNGVAGTAVSLQSPPGAYQLVVSFSGTPDEYEGSETAADFVVAKEDTVTALTVDTHGSKKTFTATLSDADTPAAGIGGAVIDFYADGTLVGSATTNADGVAVLEAKVTGKKHVYQALYAGDDFYLGSSGQSTE